MAVEAVPTWRRIGKIVGWLFLFPPMGAWKLWKDETLSQSAKWRILIYLFVVPMLAYAAISLWMANSALERLIP